MAAEVGHPHRTRRSRRSCGSSRRSGLRRLRITGGEPTIRPQISTSSIADAARDPGDRGHRALDERRAAARSSRRLLATAGLDRVNMSADSVCAPIASRRSRGATSASIRSPRRRRREDAGLGADQDQRRRHARRSTTTRSCDFARLTLEHPWHVRFIELMPVGDMRELTWEHVVPSDEVLRRDSRRVAPLAPRRGPARGNGPRAILSACRARAARSASSRR